MLIFFYYSHQNFNNYSSILDVESVNIELLEGENLISESGIITNNILLNSAQNMMFSFSDALDLITS
jgi:hypothetical protein